MDVQDFDGELTDVRRARLVDPEGRSVSVRVDDSGGRLVAHPRGISLWFAAICVFIPVGIFAGLMAKKALDSGLGPLERFGLGISFLAAPSLVAIIHWINRQQVQRGDFFVLDRAPGCLSLPRTGVRLLPGQIRGFVEVHAWHTIRDEDCRPSEWLAELSVLANTENGEIARYPVIACQRTGAVHRLGESLSLFFDVECKVIKLNWRMRRHLSALAGEERLR